jgi:hypothetical protein
MRGGEETFEEKLMSSIMIPKNYKLLMRLLIKDTLELNPAVNTDNDILLGLNFLDGETFSPEVFNRLGKAYQTIKQELRNREKERRHHGMNNYNKNSNNPEKRMTKMLIASAVYSELTRVGIPDYKPPSDHNAKDILETFVKPKFEKPISVEVPLVIYYLYIRNFMKKNNKILKFDEILSKMRLKLDEILSKITNNSERQILSEIISS